MGTFFDEIAIIGFTAAGDEARALIEKLEGVDETNLLQALDALGEGEYCGKLNLFSRFGVRPLTGELFVKERVPGWERSIEVGNDESGRCVAVEANADGCRFYIVDWKHDEVMKYITFEACLNGWINLSGPGLMCRCPFHLGSSVNKVVYDVSWEFGVVVALVKKALHVTLEHYECRDSQGCWRTFAKGLNLMIEVSAEDQVNCVWCCSEEQTREVARLCDRWLALAAEDGLDVPVCSYGEW